LKEEHMRHHRHPCLTAVLVACALAVTLVPRGAAAHCDGLDGPVVKAAQEALAKEDIRLVLLWVREQDSDEIRRAFDETLAVRKLSGDARKLADRYFFETLVRLHRTSEGAPYTGLKPAGRDMGLAIPAADQALKSGDLGPVIKLLTDETRAGLVRSFDATVKAKTYPVADVDAGRRYVRAYVEFIHLVERIHEAAVRNAEGHFPDSHKK
jgi:hypothetical protein